MAIRVVKMCVTHSKRDESFTNICHSKVYAILSYISSLEQETHKRPSVTSGKFKSSPGFQYSSSIIILDLNQPFVVSIFLVYFVMLVL